MEEKDPGIVEAADLNGTPIKIGTTVKYINSDTVGIVTDIKQDAEGVWALVDETDLYYKVEALVVSDVKIHRKEEKEREITGTDALEYLTKQAELMGSEDTKGIHGVGGG